MRVGELFRVDGRAGADECLDRFCDVPGVHVHTGQDAVGTASNRTARPPTRLGLLNCPFHHLAARSPELACGINHAFVCGNLDGLEATGVDAVLAPHPGQCCVELREPRTDAAEPPAGEGCARDHGGASPR